MPVFKGLVHSEHEDIIQTLIFHLAEWHALAKLRLQTEDTLALLDQALQRLSAQVRRFQDKTCTAFEIKELPQESARRQRRELAEMQSSRRKTPARSSPLRKSFNINTYKFHALGDYTQVIKTFGMTDSYSTQIVSALCSSDVAWAKNTPRAKGPTNWSNTFMEVWTRKPLKCSWAGKKDGRQFYNDKTTYPWT